MPRGCCNSPTVNGLCSPRETIEAVIIISVLLSFLKQTIGGPDNDPKIYKRLVWQVWIGTFSGFFICLAIGGGFIGAFYSLGKNVWGGSEDLWEAIFCLIASVIITIMGAAILRLSKLRAKWSAKIAASLEAKDTKGIGARSKKYAMLLLPFITVMREGLEAVIFVGGVSLSQPASAFPLPAVTGLVAGGFIGWLLYKGGNSVRIQWFLIASTMFLYLVSASLFSRAAWGFGNWKYGRLVRGDIAETGTGPGSYDIRKSVWHVNCCSPTFNGGGGWSVFNSVLGWQNSATYGSVISYNIYWISVSMGFLLMLFREKEGRYPFMKPSAAPSQTGPDDNVIQMNDEGQKGDIVPVTQPVRSLGV